MNGSIMKIAGEEALRQNIAKTKEYVQQHGGGGHTIITASSLPMAGQPNLQFEGVHVENVGQAGQGKTVIKPQFHVCATKAEWDAMSPAEQNDPLVYWVRPWANSDAFATDRTPVGTVISVGAAKTGEATGVSTPTGRFPTDDYLVCDGSTYITVDNKTVYICQQNFPKLYDYFVEAYGTATYFGSGRGQQGDFSLPDWSADFPENGILCIKAQISSTAITYHEIDDTGIYAGEDKVPSCARVAEIEGDVSDIEDSLYANITAQNSSTFYKDLINYSSSNPYRAPCDGYIFAKASGGTGRIRFYMTLALDIPSGYWTSFFVKKGGAIYKEDNISNIVFEAFW